jgi:hypothetical protein
MLEVLQDKLAVAGDINAADARFNLWLALRGQDKDGNRMLRCWKATRKSLLKALPSVSAEALQIMEARKVKVGGG